MAVQYIPITVAIVQGSVANPILGTSFQAIAPWGQGQPQPTIDAALNDVLFRGGSQTSGAFGAYMSASTINGASGAGPTVFTSANNL